MDNLEQTKWGRSQWIEVGTGFPPPQSQMQLPKFGKQAPANLFLSNFHLQVPAVLTKMGFILKIGIAALLKEPESY